MAIELATAYVSIVPSARGIEGKLAKELKPVSSVAAAQGLVAGKALGGTFSKGIGAAGIATSVERESTKAAGAGSRILSRFALRTGTLFTALDRQLGNFGGPFTGNLTTIATSLRTVATGEKNATLGASEFQRVGTAAYLGIGLAAAGFAGVSIKAALGAEQAHAQLEQAVKATGHSYEDVAGSVDKAIKKLAQFGFDQEEVDASLAKLTRAAKDPAKALDLIGVAADIARARNLDLSSASQILVNIEAGRVRGLAQLGISTKDAAGNTVDATEAVRRITALYGGAAQASAATYAGKLQAVGATAHNLEEDLGGKLLPVVADVGKGLLDGVHGFEAVNKATHGWLGTLGGAAFVAGGVAVAVSKVSSGITKLVDLFGVERTAASAAAESEVALTAARTGSAAASGAAAAATAAAADAEQAEVAVALEDTAAQEALAAALDQVAFGAGSTAAALDAVALASGAAATSSTAGAVAVGAQAKSVGLLGTSFSGLAAPLAAVTVGLLAGKKAGDEIIKMTTDAKPSVDELTASLIRLEQGQTGAFDFAKVGKDLRNQVNRSDVTDKPGVATEAQTFFRALHKDARDAKQEIGPLNDALKSILETEGPANATRAYGLLAQGFMNVHVPISTISSDFAPFIAKLDLANAKAGETGTSVSKLSVNFQDLAKSFTDESAVLGIADQFDAAKQAIDDLNQLKLDAAGVGQKSIDAARAEEQARQSLSDAYRSEQTAVANLADAKAKLAQFDSRTDQRIRFLEQQQIQDRVVKTPEEARQKEIDLLKFGEDNANKRADLQKAIVSGEAQVQSATEGVTKAQEDVSTASKARAQIQVDAANGIAAAERKAKEATDAVGTALINADAAGQLGKGNEQLSIYVSLLDDLLKQVDPTNPQIKNLDDFLNKLSLANTLKQALGGQLGPAPFVGPGGVPQTIFQPPAPPTGPTAKPSVTINTTNNVTATDIPTANTLETLNRKQGIRLAALIPA